MKDFALHQDIMDSRTNLENILNKYRTASAQEIFNVLLGSIKNMETDTMISDIAFLLLERFSLEKKKTE